jgi:acetaldehyde dehydrogenase
VRPQRWPVAIIGSGDIATNLMVKILRGDGPLTMAAVADGVDGLMAMPIFSETRLVFDATATGVHENQWAQIESTGVRVIDLTPTAIGPYCVPAVNLDEHLTAANLNMVTCAGQATVPIVAAVARIGIVSYAEAVASISSRSVGGETRANIDQFIETTASALQVVGGAQRGKAVAILSPADPPTLARNTVFCLVDGDPDRAAIESSILDMVARVRAYVPGFRLKQRVQFESFGVANPLYIPETGKFSGTRVTVLLEVAAADDLPAYAGNIDIMTSAAKATGECIATYTDEIAGATA